MEHPCPTSLIFFCFSTIGIHRRNPKNGSIIRRKQDGCEMSLLRKVRCSPAAWLSSMFLSNSGFRNNIVEFLVFKAPCGELSGCGIADLLWKLKQIDSWCSILAFSSFQNHIKTSHLRNTKYQIINHHCFWDFLLKWRGFLSLWITPGDAGLRLIQTAGWHPYRSASPPRWCQWLRTWASLWNGGNICAIISTKRGSSPTTKFENLPNKNGNETKWSHMITSSSASKKYSPQDPTMLHRATWRIGRCSAPEIKERPSCSDTAADKSCLNAFRDPTRM